MTTFRDWIRETVDPQDIDALANHGAGEGIPGMTYTKDIDDLYERFTDDIWTIVANDAEAEGMSALQWLGCLPNVAYGVNRHSDLTEALVWYAAERVASDMVEGR